MRTFLIAFVLILASLAAVSPLVSAAPGAVRCGQLLDVRTGHLLKEIISVAILMS